MLIAQKLSDLLDGISQRPAADRPASQAEVQENILSHRTLGVRRRPPTVQVGQLSADTTGYSAAFTHAVRRSTTDRYYVVVVGGDLKVFDAQTGAAQTVVFPKGKDYLTSTSGFKAFTVGDTTYLLNKDVVVRRGTTKAPAQAYEALLFVRQADYSTRYSITLNGITVNVDTPDASSPQARPSIATDTLAAQIEGALTTVRQIGSDFTIIRYGSTLYVRRNDGKDFTITSSDGLSDNGLKIVKGSVQTFADLPVRAKGGMIVQVAGDPENAADDYWLQYDDSATAGELGVWIECAAPGTPLGLDATTMPWALERGGTLLDALVADELPALPFISDVQSTTSSQGFTSDPDTSETFPGTTDIILTNDQQKVDATVSPADGSNRTLTAFYDVDTTAMDYGMVLTVSLYLDNGSGMVLQNSREYGAGIQANSESLDYIGAVNSGAVLRLEIDYSAGSTPTQRSRLGQITVHRDSATSGDGTAAPGIISIFTSAINVGFNSAHIYPVGTVITLTVNTTPFTYTVGSADVTGLTVANALATLIAASFTVVNAGDGSFTVSDGGTPISWDIAATVTPNTSVFFSAALTLTPGEYVGKVLKNLTDGSSGTITANDVHSITVTLSGGINSAFSTDDQCQIIGAGSDFVFTTEAWDDRKAGDLTICPLPSFVDQALSEIFFFDNRLGFAAGTAVVLSESGKQTNFMRTTATQLLPSDVIDIESADPNAGTFDSAVQWDDALYFLSSSGHQYALEGTPILSPQTVSLTAKSSFPVASNVRPVVLGRFMYFAQAMSNAFTTVMQYFQRFNQTTDAEDITINVPKYLTGAPVMIVGDSKLEFMAVLTSGATDTLWIHTFHYEADPTSVYSGSQKTMDGWSKWTFSGAQIVAVDMLDGILSMILVRSDGVYLETINVGVPPAGNADYRDRQGNATPVAFVPTYQFSTIFYRGQNNVPETRGRLQLRNAILSYHDTTDFTITVTAAGRAPMAYTFHSDAPATGEFPFPIQTRNTTATISISTPTAGGFAFTGLDWEGDYTARARRV